MGETQFALPQQSAEERTGEPLCWANQGKMGDFFPLRTKN
jgi:hypothetical protein